MTHAKRLMAGAAVALAGAVTIGCQNGVTGPSLSASIQTLTLVPTVEHVQLQFPAKTGGTEVGRAVVLEKDLAPGAVRPFEAPGLMVPCGQLDSKQVLADAVVRPIGLWQPN